MATTEQRTGFRLPWSSEDRSGGRQTDVTNDSAPEERAEVAAATVETPTPADEAVDARDGAARPEPVPDDIPTALRSPASSEPDPIAPSTAEQVTEETPVQSSASPVAPSRPAAAAPRKPTKFLADLTRAMQAAAESSRVATLEQLQAEAKTHIEQVHARSADEVAELRREADDDIVGIREWSKAELARIREETERKISTRRKDLESELESHAARIEREIDGVQGRVSGFEAEMEGFFERLMREEDPAEFAAMAENLPEPPPFSGAYEDPSYAATGWDRSDEAADSDSAVPAPVDDDPVYAATAGSPEAPIQAAESAVVPDTGTFTDHSAAAGAATEAAGQDEPPVAEAAMAESEPEAAVDGDAQPPTSEGAITVEAEAVEAEAVDPRLAALGLTPDLGEAEAEAAALAADHGDDDEIPTIGDDALASRLAGLVPPTDQMSAMTRTSAPTSAPTTKVVVTGLISVASIASFKRHLGRIDGVQSVGVSSGPDGEFVFAVAHGAEVALGDVIPTLSGFEARVTGTGEGVLTVAARDPESEA